MNIIGINGFKRSGKGEVFKGVRRAIEGPDGVGPWVQGAGFADKLKILAAKTLGFLDRTDQECIDLMDSFKLDEPMGAQLNIYYGEPGDLEADVLHELTGREFLQNLGSQARKVFGDDFWVNQVLPNPARFNTNAAARAITASQYPGVDVLCITDLRYPNEAQRVLDLGGVVWEVIRPGQKSDGHDSEQPLDRKLVTRQLINCGDLLDLHQLAALAYKEDFSS